MGAYDDLGAVPVAPTDDYADLGATPAQKATPEPNMSDVKKVFDSHLAEAKAQTPTQPAQHPADGFVEDLKAGWQMSTLGLVTHHAMPDTVLPENASRMAKILAGAGTFAGDIPAMLVGGAVGYKVAGKPGASAGAFAFPAGLRQALVDHYEKGDIKDPSDFVDRASSVLLQTLKGAGEGLAVYATGKGVGNLLPTAMMPLAKAAVTTGAEAAALTTAAAAMDGKLPHPSDFVDNAVFMGLMHGTFAGANKIAPKVFSSMSDSISSKTMDVYSKTGLLPHEVSEMAEQDPVVRQEVLSKDKVLPPSLENFKDPKAPEDQHITINPNPELVKDGEAGDLKVKPLPDDKNPALPEKIAEEPVHSEAVKATLDRIGEQPTVEKEPISKERIQQDLNKLYFSALDDKDPLKNLTMAVLGKEALGTKDDPYGLARSISNVARKADLIIDKGPREFATTEKTGTRGLTEIWKDAAEKGSLEEYRAFKIAKQDIEMAKQGLKTGADLEKSQAVVKELQPKYGDLAKEEVKFGNDNLKYLSDSGVISKEQLKAMLARWEDYSPTKRVQDADVKGSKKGGGMSPHNPIMSREGSERKLIDPLVSRVKDTQQIIAMAERNRVMTSLAKLIDQANKSGDESWGQRTKTPLKAIDVTEQETAKMLKDQGLDPDEAKNLASSMTIFRKDNSPLKDDQFSMYENGKKVLYENVPEEIVRTIRGLDQQTASPILKALAGPSKLLRTGTLSNPAFGIRHFIRQEVLGTALSKDLHIPVWHTIKGLSGMMGGSSEEFDSWIMHGGGSDSIASIDNTYIKSKIFDLDKETGFLGDKVNQVKNGLQFVKHAIELTDEARTFQKNQSRLASGIDPWKAAFDARDTGIDVQRQGASMRAYAMLDPFQNIKIQGLDLIARRLSEDPLGVGTKLLATVTAPSVLLWYANHDKKWFQEIPEKIRDLNWHIAVGDPDKDGHVIKVPKPFEPGIVFGSLVERLLDAFFTEKPHAFNGFKDSITEAVTPGYVPTFVQPVVEQYANKSFLTKAPLIPKQMENVLPEYQYKPYTSDVAKIIASGLRLIPSDLTQKPGSLGSPAIVDNYIQNWTGGAGQLLVAGLNSALEKSGLADKMGLDYIHEKPEPTWADNPFFKSFVQRYPTENSRSVNDFFDRFEKTQARMNTISMLAKNGDVNNWQKEQEIAMHQNEFMKLDGLKQAISKQMGMASLTYKLPGDVMDKTQKRQLLDFYYNSITNTARMANEMLDGLDKDLSKMEKGKQGK